MFYLLCASYTPTRIWAIEFNVKYNVSRAFTKRCCKNKYPKLFREIERFHVHFFCVDCGWGNLDIRLYNHEQGACMFCDNLSTYIMVTLSCHSSMKCKENLSFIKLYLDGIVCPDLRRGKLQSYIHLNLCGRVMIN